MLEQVKGDRSLNGSLSTGRGCGSMYTYEGRFGMGITVLSEIESTTRIFVILNRCGRVPKMDKQQRSARPETTDERGTMPSGRSAWSYEDGGFTSMGTAATQLGHTPPQHKEATARE